MERRRSALGELWAWLAGLLLPVGALATALAFTITGESTQQPGPVPSTTLVAGASAQPPVTVAPTATPRDALGQTTVAAPPVSQPSATQPPLPQPQPDVAGIQVQPAPPTFIPTVGAGHAPLVAPALALLFGVAGFAWRVHTSAPWPSRNHPLHRKPA